MMYRYFPGRMLLGGHLFGLLLAVLFVVGIVLLIVALASRNNHTPVAHAAQGAPAADGPAPTRSLGAVSLDARWRVTAAGLADTCRKAT